MATRRASPDALFKQAQTALSVFQFNRCQSHLEVVDFPAWDELTKIRYLRALIHKAKIVEIYEEQLAAIVLEKRRQLSNPAYEPSLADHSQAIIQIAKP